MVWLMGSRSIVSSCLTSLRHMGHRTLRFLDGESGTCRTWWGTACRMCARSESLSSESDVLYRNFSYKECTSPCRATCSRTRRSICDRDQEDFRPAWKRMWSGSPAFSFNSKNNNYNYSLKENINLWHNQIDINTAIIRKHLIKYFWVTYF